MTELYHNQYVELDVLDNGNLRFAITLLGRKEVLENRHENASDDDVVYDLYTDNDSIHRPDANGGPLLLPDISNLDGGHLSNAPCVVDEWYLNDDMVKAGEPMYLSLPKSRIWYHNDYMIESMLDSMMRDGYVELTLLK